MVEESIFDTVKRYFAKNQAVGTPVKLNVFSSLKDMYGHVL